MKLQKIFSTTLIVCSLASFSSARSEILPDKAPENPKNPTTPEKVILGKNLFFDPRLSADGTVSCQSCHAVTGSGTDDRPTSAGIRGQLGGRNSPTVWNSAFHSVQFWDGRAATLEDQAKGPLINPIEMGNKDHAEVIARLKKIKGYGPLFKAAFGSDKIDIERVAQAIAAFERTLITPNSPYDRYMKGDKKAISAAAVKGLELVEEIGCRTCHMGPNFNGPIELVADHTGFYQKFPTYGLGEGYDKKYGFSKDLGRYGVTKNEDDKHMFRVPTWRNVAHTAPYFHNGSVKTLDEAVRVMAKVQLNKELKDGEVKNIVEFLKSLAGEYPKIEAPRLPPMEGESLY